MLDKYAALKAMKNILTNPTRKFSVRELARSTGLSVFATKHSLDFMLEKEMVTLEKVGRTYQYKANLDNYLARQWKVTFTLEELNKAKVVSNILKTEKSILSIIIYGSTAIGRDDENSDIDIIVIADTSPAGMKEIAKQAHGTEREINISAYSPQNWKEKAKKDKIFYEHVIIDSIALFGEKPVVL